MPPVFNDVQTTFLWLPKPASQHRSCNEGAGGGLSHLTKHGPTWIWIRTGSRRTFLHTVSSACTTKGSQSLVVDFCLYPANLIWAANTEGYELRRNALWQKQEIHTSKYNTLSAAQDSKENSLRIHQTYYPISYLHLIPRDIYPNCQTSFHCTEGQKMSHTATLRL